MRQKLINFLKKFKVFRERRQNKTNNFDVVITLKLRD